MLKRTALRLLTEEELQELTKVSRSRTEAARRVERAKIILALHEGTKAEEIARQFNVSCSTVDNRRRFNKEGLSVPPMRIKKHSPRFPL